MQISDEGKENRHPVIPAFFSPEGKDFMRIVFSLDPRKRQTAAQLLEHPWVAFPPGEGCGGVCPRMQGAAKDITGSVSDDGATSARRPANGSIHAATEQQGDFGAAQNDYNPSDTCSTLQRGDTSLLFINKNPAAGAPSSPAPYPTGTDSTMSLGPAAPTGSSGPAAIGMTAGGATVAAAVAAGGMSSTDAAGRVRGASMSDRARLAACTQRRRAAASAAAAAQVMARAASSTVGSSDLTGSSQPYDTTNVTTTDDSGWPVRQVSQLLAEGFSLSGEFEPPIDYSNSFPPLPPQSSVIFAPSATPPIAAAPAQPAPAAAPLPAALGLDAAAATLYADSDGRSEQRHASTHGGHPGDVEAPSDLTSSDDEATQAPTGAPSVPHRSIHAISSTRISRGGRGLGKELADGDGEDASAVSGVSSADDNDEGEAAADGGSHGRGGSHETGMFSAPTLSAATSSSGPATPRSDPLNDPLAYHARGSQLSPVHVASPRHTSNSGSGSFVGTAAPPPADVVAPTHTVVAPSVPSTSRGHAVAAAEVATTASSQSRQSRRGNSTGPIWDHSCSDCSGEEAEEEEEEEEDKVR
jgi:hypothetical protein